MTNFSEYPIPAFRFKLSLGQTGKGGSNKSSDTSFQEISGISTEIPVEELTEGGENRFVHRLPQPLKYSNLILKRGFTTGKSELMKWCNELGELDYASTIKPKELQVSLMDERDKPVMSWRFINAYPIKWEYSALDAAKNEVLIQTIEITYQYYRELM